MGLMANVAVRSQINGPFTGFSPDALFSLANGTYWLQCAQGYWHHYAYRPDVEVIANLGVYSLRLLGHEEAVTVKQVHGVITSQISGAFEGWHGESIYELTNGQVWKQIHYRYEYRYIYRPEVLIYDTPSGKVMDVDGCRATVQQIR